MEVGAFLSGALGGTLIVSALAKLPDRGSVVSFIRALGLPSSTARMLFVGGVAAELVVGLALVLNRVPRHAAVGSLALASMFIAMHAMARARRVSIHCGCFGFLEDGTTGRNEMSRAMLLAATAAVVTAFAFLVPRDGVDKMTNVFGALVGAGVVLAWANLLYAKQTFGQTREVIHGVSR